MTKREQPEIVCQKNQPAYQRMVEIHKQLWIMVSFTATDEAVLFPRGNGIPFVTADGYIDWE